MFKRGEVNRAFQRRWCVLKGNLLFYSEKPSDREPLGVIILEGCTVELAEEETSLFAFKIVFNHGGGRDYLLGADTMEDLEAWMKLIASASYDYMRLMVVELQKQLEELEERESVEAVAVAGEGRGKVTAPRRRFNLFNLLLRKEKHGRSWEEIHNKAGFQIIEDRKEWILSKRKAAF